MRLSTIRPSIVIGLLASMAFANGLAFAQPADEPVEPAEPAAPAEPEDENAPPDIEEPVTEPVEPPVETTIEKPGENPVEPPSEVANDPEPSDDTPAAKVETKGEATSVDPDERYANVVGDTALPADMRGDDVDLSEYVDAGMQIFAEYAFSLRKENGSTEWFHEFELPRAHAYMHGRYENAEGRVLVEGVRSTAEGALLGVGGDSIVLRLREAYAGYTLFDMLKLQAGLVRTFTIPMLEGAWLMRPVQPVMAQRAGLLTPADLGATARVYLPAGYGWIAVGGFNGDGYRSRELNRGKNIEIAAEIHPLASIKELAPIGIAGSYIAGSSGTALAQSNRIDGSLFYGGEWIRAGVATTYALGIRDNSDQKSLVFEGFARVEPIEKLLLGANVGFWNRNLDTDADTVTQITGAAGYRIARPLEAYLAVERTVLGERAEPALPDQNEWRFRAITHVFF